MPFHADLVSAWPTDLANLSGVATANVYFGRRPQRVKRTDTEIAILQGEVEPLSTGGFSNVNRYTYELHIREPGGPGGNNAGDAAQATNNTLARAIVDRYHGERQMAASLTTLVGTHAEIHEPDEDPASQEAVTSVVTVAFVVNE